MDRSWGPLLEEKFNMSADEDPMDDTNECDDNERLFSAEGKEINDERNIIRRFIDGLAKSAKKDGLRLFLLVFANGLYLYLGGLVFYAAEKTPKRELDPKLHVEMFLRAMKRTKAVNVTALYQLSASELVARLDKKDMEKLIPVLQSIHHDWNEYEADPWTITSSVFFASTVVTTIGYGNLSPKTDWGRAFCVLYAIIGIPLTLMLLAMVGKILSKYINDLCGIVLGVVRKYLYPDYKYDSTEGETELNAPVWLAVSFIILFISLDALVFMYMEKWSFGVALYFVFITLTTIGFGDIVPQNQAAVWFNVTLLYIGLAAISITINLMIAHINIQYKKHKDHLKFVSKIEEELHTDDDSDGESSTEKTPLASRVSP